MAASRRHSLSIVPPALFLALLALGVSGCAGRLTSFGDEAMTYRTPMQDPGAKQVGDVYTVLGGVSSAHNHFPGPDGLIGTADDQVSSYISPILGSDANFRGSLSYISGALPTAPGDSAYFPATHNGASFGEGTVTIDPTVAASGGGPLILDWDLVGTAPIQGQGASFLEMLTVNGGTYDPTSGAMTLDFSPRLTTGGETLEEPSIVSAGTARVLQSPFPITGDTYIDTVLTPLAQALGADGLFFARLDTTVPGVITIQTSTVLVAVRNAAEATDLTLTATVSPAAGATPGSTFGVALTASNGGPLAATGVEATVFLPAGLTWTAGDCGGPPAGGEIVWSVGGLGSGGSAQCSFSGTVDAGTPFDVAFGASLFADQLDTAPDDNFVPLQLEVVSGGPEGLDQPVASSPYLFPADLDCDVCSSGMQTLGGNFKVNGPFTLEGIGFFGVYTDNNAFGDAFTIQLRNDTGAGLGPRSPGVPGGLVQALAGAPTRTATGNVLWGAFTEYEYSLTASVPLQRGTYWLTMYNDSSGVGGTGDWVWVSGAADAQGRSLAAMSASASAPPTIRWSINPDADVHLAFNMAGTTGTAQGVGIPVLAPVAAVALSVVIALIGILLLRRRSA